MTSTTIEDHREDLWKAVLAKVDELQKVPDRRGTSRTQAYYSTDGTECLCVSTVGLPDGTWAVDIIKASWNWTALRQPLSVHVSRSYHSSEHFWEQELADRSNAVVVNGHHYRIGDENARGMRGFGGRRYVLESLETGEQRATTNLRYQGIIPPMFRDRLPDTHRFVDDQREEDLLRALHQAAPSER